MHFKLQGSNANTIALCEVYICGGMKKGLSFLIKTAHRCSYANTDKLTNDNIRTTSLAEQVEKTQRNIKLNYSKFTLNLFSLYRL